MCKTKRCASCKDCKPYSEFYKNRERSDGMSTYCKRCHYKRYKRERKGWPKPKTEPIVGKTKVCPRCKVNKDYSLYHKDSKRKTGRMAACRECCNKAYRKRYAGNKEWRKKQIHRAKEKNDKKEKPIHQSLAYKNCHLCGEMYEIRLHGGDHASKKNTKYCSRACSRKAMLERQRIENNRQRRTNPKFAIANRMRCMLWNRLKRRTNTPGNRLVTEHLPYTTAQLKAHLEKKFKPGMTWEKFLNGEIHIDHIKPDSRFEYTSTECKGFKQSWALKNLQPLWADQNVSKSNRIIIGEQAQLQI